MQETCSIHTHCIFYLVECRLTCFGTKKAAEGAAVTELPWYLFQSCCSWSNRSCEDKLSILGGWEQDSFKFSRLCIFRKTRQTIWNPEKIQIYVLTFLKFKKSIFLQEHVAVCWKRCLDIAFITKHLLTIFWTVFVCTSFIFKNFSFKKKKVYVFMNLDFWMCWLNWSIVLSLHSIFFKKITRKEGKKIILSPPFLK